MRRRGEIVEQSFAHTGTWRHAPNLVARARAVGIDGSARRLVTMPSGEPLALRLGDPRLADAAVEIRQYGAGVVALVGNQFGGFCGRRRPADAGQVRLRRPQRILQRP
jgi:hypothetical protein